MVPSTATTPSPSPAVSSGTALSSGTVVATSRVAPGAGGTSGATSARPGPGASPARPAPSTLPVVPPAAPATTTAPSVLPPETQPPIFAPGEEGLHKELIPRNIQILRCYYDQDVVAPDTTFGFDINGTGFTESFHQMIAVDFDALDVEVQDLRLVTANQIHGIIHVGADATTQYIYPKVLIRNLPVFKARDPFGVVRRGEVLDINLTSIDETGQSGRFRVITNLDKDLMKRFRLEPTTPKLEVGNITPQLPFYVDGVVQIAPGLRNGEYGLTAFMGTRALMRKDPIVDVVKPNVGKTGTVESLKASDPAHRPGDLVDMLLTGSGFTSGDAATLSAKVTPSDLGTVKFTYVSQGKMQVQLQLPAQAPVGVYGMTVSQSGKTVYTRKSVFAIVPANWLGAVKLAGPVAPGQTGMIKIIGRDISLDFTGTVKVDVDEPGLKLSAPRLQDPSAIVIDLQVAPDVAPGDYVLHITAGGKPMQLPGGNIIKISR